MLAWMNRSDGVDRPAEFHICWTEVGPQAQRLVQLQYLFVQNCAKLFPIARCR
jgi:hypothetical protein